MRLCCAARENACSSSSAVRTRYRRSPGTSCASNVTGRLLRADAAHPTLLSRKTLITLRPQRLVQPWPLPPFPALSMGERIEIGPASKIELDPGRKEGEAGLRQAQSPLADKHGVKFGP